MKKCKCLCKVLMTNVMNTYLKMVIAYGSAIIMEMYYKYHIVSFELSDYCTVLGSFSLKL